MSLYKKKKTPAADWTARAERNERRDSIITKNQQDYCSTSSLISQLVLKVQEVNNILYDPYKETLYPFVKFEVSPVDYDIVVFYEGENECETIRSEHRQPLDDGLLKQMIEKVEQVGELRRKLYGRP